MLLFTLYNLAIHPEVQEKTFEEIKNALHDTATSLTPKILGNLPYLKAVVKESFRYNAISLSPPPITVLLKCILSICFCTFTGLCLMELIFLEL